MSFTRTTAKILCTYRRDQADTGTTVLSFGPDYAHGANAEWAESTPSLDLRMTVVQEVAARFQTGQAFTLTFEPDDDEHEGQAAVDEQAEPPGLVIADTRWPAVREYRAAFDSAHLPPGLPRTIMDGYRAAAQLLVDRLPDSARLVHGLHQLWQSKNEVVYAAVRQQQAIDVDAGTGS